MPDNMNEMKSTLKLIDQRLEGIETRLHKNSNIIFGRDGDGGLVVDVDRLKEAKKYADKNILVAWTAFAGVIIQAIWNFLTSHR